MRFALYLVILLSYSLPSSISLRKTTIYNPKVAQTAMFIEICPQKLFVHFFSISPRLSFFLSFESSTTLVTLSTHRLLRYSISRL